MYNLDTFGIMLLIGLLVFAGGLYLVFQARRAGQKLPSQRAGDLAEEDSFRRPADDAFETAFELFPDITFPPDQPSQQVPELPWGYDDNRITVMARDPEWIFAYWDISEDYRHHLRNCYGPGFDTALPVLRVYDVTDVDCFQGFNENHCFDVVVDDYAGSWYVHVGVAGRTYCCDLGRILSDGTFVTLTRSNLTFTPRNTVSDRIDPDWMLPPDKERLLWNRTGPLDGISSAELFRKTQ